MKTLLLAVVLVMSVVIDDAFAFRCGTNLINEGDSVTRMIELCGHAAQNNFSTVIYENFQGTGMTYIIHVNGAGMIGSIEASRSF